MLESLNWSILGPAFFAGLLVLSTHVPRGQEVLKRGIIFIDLAIAQIAGLGVLAAGVLGWEDNLWAVQIAAVSAALLASAGLSWSEKQWPQLQEALIGILFVLAATGSILLLAENPHGAEHMEDLLVGQILWSTWQSLIHMTVLYAFLLTVWYRFHAYVGHKAFYVIFAFAVTASVQIVGVYLVFASLIIPALATRRLHGKTRLLAGYALGAAGYLAGITLSALFDLPTGAVTVWTMALLSVAVGFWLGHKAAGSRAC